GKPQPNRVNSEIRSNAGTYTANDFIIRAAEQPAFYSRDRSFFFGSSCFLITKLLRLAHSSGNFFYIAQGNNLFAFANALLEHLCHACFYVLHDFVLPFA